MAVFDLDSGNEGALKITLRVVLEWVENGPRLIHSKASTITTPQGAYGPVPLAELIEILNTVNYCAGQWWGGEQVLLSTGCSTRQTC